jgi:hypothetical protein
VCDPKCSHFKVGILAFLFLNDKLSEGIKNLKFSKQIFWVEHSIMVVHWNKNQHKLEQTLTLKHTK